MKFRLEIDKNAEEEVVAIVHAPSKLTREIENLVSAYAGTDGIMVQNDEGIKKLKFEETECITVLDRKVYAIDGEGNRYRIGERLRELEKILPAYFIRINKSTIANEHSILRYDTVFTGGVDAVFLCGFREYVSRRCFAEIRRRYK